MPVPVGKRVCLGETLAKLTLFLFFASILQKYSFEVSPTHGHPNLRPAKGFTLAPDPFYIFVKRRL